MLHSFISGAFLGLINRVIECLKELRERGVVHPFDEDHFNDTEIEYGASDGGGSELFSLNINLYGLLFSESQNIGDLFGTGLGFVQHLNQFGILNKVTSGGGQFVEEFFIELDKGFLVIGHLLHELLHVDLQLLLLFGQDSTQKLLFETGLCDSEIDNQDFSG